MLGVLLCCGGLAQAGTYKNFYSDGTVQAGETWTNINIYDTPPAHTTVTMNGGSVTDSMGVFDAATFNMNSGHVGGLNAYELSMVNISGGSVSGLSLYNNATATLSQSGSISTANALNSGIFNMNGGTIGFLGANESSILNLRGGTITDSLGANSSAKINVFGYDLAKTNSGGTYGAGQVTGFWQNGSPFTINLTFVEAYSHINLIPEPTTLLLFGAGAFLFRKSR